MMKMNFQVDSPNPIKMNNEKYFNANMNYYICSSGGCGSTILMHYLSHFGKVYHIHDRYPPDKLCYVGRENSTEDVYREWFNKTEIPSEKIQNYKVIFMYRNPIQVIFSRCIGPNVSHLKNIKCINHGLIGLKDVLDCKMDLYGLEEFFDNYTLPKNRNYEIYCVKYEQFFSNISLFNRVLGLPDVKHLYPVKNERLKNITHLQELSTIYYRLIMKMNSMPFIKVIEKKINDDDEKKINDDDEKKINDDDDVF